MDFIVSGIIKALELLASGDPETFSAIKVTLSASTISMIYSLMMGIPAGFALGFFTFKGRRVLRLMVDTCLSLPTVFIGLVVYALISSRGPLGSMGLLFTVQGIAMGQTILALPVVAALTATAVESADRDLRLTVMSLGANRIQIALSCLWEVRFGILVAAVAAYGRVLTEVGISMMVGGNIKWHTRSITTAIALETGRGMFETGIALGMVLLMIAFSVNVSLAFLRNK